MNQLLPTSVSVGTSSALTATTACLFFDISEDSSPSNKSYRRPAKSAQEIRGKKIQTYVTA